MRRSETARRALLLLGSASALVACGNSEPSLDAAALPAEGGPYRVAALERPGAIAGRCRLVGTPHPARLRAWPAMDDAERDDESVDRSDDGGLGGCVVSLAGIAAGKAWPKEMRGETRTFTLTAEPGRFVPHVAWVRAGTQVVVVSRTKDFAVHAYDGPSRGTTLANFGLAAGATVSDSPGLFLDRPVVVYLTDDARNHFTAWIHVSPHPYVAVTSAGGAWRLDDVPAGVYEVVCRHEPMDRRDSFLDRGKRHAGYLLGPMIERRGRVRVRSGETATLDFDVPTTATAPAAGTPPATTR